MYVLYVMGGKELDVVRDLNRCGYTAYAPRRQILQRKNGVYYNISQILFNGYVFVKADKITPEDYYTIKKINNVGNFLNRNLPLSGTEEEYIRGLCNNGKDIGISKGILQNGKLKITEGFLKRYEHKIIKYSRRQRRATVELTIYGKPYRIVCGVDIEKA